MMMKKKKKQQQLVGGIGCNEEREKEEEEYFSIPQQQEEGVTLSSLPTTKGRKRSSLSSYQSMFTEYRDLSDDELMDYDDDNNNNKDDDVLLYTVIIFYYNIQLRMHSDYTRRTKQAAHVLAEHCDDDYGHEHKQSRL